MIQKFFISITLFISLCIDATDRYSLITFLYNEKNEERLFEYIECLEKNLEHKLIDDIHIFYDMCQDDTHNTLLQYLQQRPVILHYLNNRPTFNDCFSLAQTICKNTRIIIANADIYFNDTLHALTTYDLAGKFLGLTRWNITKDGTLEIFKQYHPDGSFWDYSSASSQDAWLFQTPLVSFENADIQLGTMSCDSRIAYHAQKAGLMLENPCLSVQCCHLHLSPIRNYCPIISHEPLQVIYWSELPVSSQITNKKIPSSSWDHILADYIDKNAFPFMSAKDKSKYSLDTPFLLTISKLFNIDCFIETGTYLGDTIVHSLPLFSQIYSIELDKTLAQAAQIRFSKNKNVLIYEGNSPDILAQLLKAQAGKKLIYLDANYNGGLTAKGKTNNPILEELAIIKHSGITNATLIIDDTRLFYDPLCPVTDTVFEGYPSLNQLVEKILEINPHYHFACIHDVLLVFCEQTPMTPLIRACTISRLYDGTNFDLITVLTAEKIIAQAQGIEKETLKNLAENFTEPWGLNFGLSRHYPFWYGLVLFNRRDYQQAYNHFKQAYDRGLSHWRVKWYMSCAQSYIGENT